MDTETQNRILIFSELLEKIRDTEGPLTLFELDDLFDSNQQAYDLIFHGIPGLSYNRAKEQSIVLSPEWRVIPVVTDITSIPEIPVMTPEGLRRFVLNNGEVEVYDYVEKSPFRSKFDSRAYNFTEENSFFRHVQNKNMEREIKNMREKIDELFPNQAASTYSR